MGKLVILSVLLIKIYIANQIITTLTYATLLYYYDSKVLLTGPLALLAVTLFSAPIVVYIITKKMYLNHLAVT